MKYGFIYLWFDKKHKKYYLGRHWGNISDSYICSSNTMRDAYKRRPNDFKRKLISFVYTSKKDLVLEEQYWLNMIKKEELGIRYYNKSLRSDSPSMLGFKHSEDTKNKIRESAKERGFSEYARMKQKQSAIGRKQSDQEKEKRAVKLRGLKRSQECKDRMKKPKKKVTCPHCDKIGGLASMTRWHFYNCNKYIKENIIGVLI
jgi:hypothetical protein